MRCKNGQCNIYNNIECNEAEYTSMQDESSDDQHLPEFSDQAQSDLVKELPRLSTDHSSSLTEDIRVESDSVEPCP